ncbi:MFS transporter [Brachybacterium paraconglomeratum]|uniref:MFS transporter n=1 Tax=Brachybacterium paraconglomeratum TaxID=173362 RepID=UPI0035162D95
MTTPAPGPASRGGRSPAAVLRGLVPSVYAPSLLEFVGLAALMPVIPLLARDLGFSVPQAAALSTIFGLTSFLGPIPAGRLISRIGARAALVITGCLLVVSNLLAFVLIAPALGGGGDLLHRTALVVLLLVMAASTQVWQLGRQAYLGTALPATMRARGMTLFGGVIRVGEVIGPLLGAVVMAAGSMAWVFLLFALTAAAGTVMVAVFLPPGEARADGAQGRRGRAPRTTARVALDRAVLRRMVAVGVGIAPVMMARVNRPVIVPLLGDALGLDPVWISVVFGISAALEILLVIPAGTLMDRYGRSAVAVPCALVMGAGFLLLALLGTVWAGGSDTAAVLALLLPSLLIGLGNGLGSGIVMTVGIDVSPAHGRTRYLSWWNTMLGAGRLSAPLLVTAITLLAPVAVAGAATGALCVAGGMWLSRTLPRVTPSGGTRGR